MNGVEGFFRLGLAGFVLGAVVRAIGIAVFVFATDGDIRL